MKSKRILFQDDGKAYTPKQIQNEISMFQDSYIKATEEIIQLSKKLDKNGEIFVYCAARILISFKMTRRGPFNGIDINDNKNVIGGKILRDIWDDIGDELLVINESVLNSGLSRGRYLLLLDQNHINILTTGIWNIFKCLLQFTMTENIDGLVGASKLLFSVLPEIVLPIDTKQWRTLFKTVDLGDVIKGMLAEIKEWESVTGEKLDKTDNTNRLTTIPSVYNVMAMAARP
ncbi:hypothetical protein ACFLWU_04940 [Chloroflexota bacterium]